METVLSFPVKTRLRHFKASGSGRRGKRATGGSISQAWPAPGDKWCT